MFKFLVLLFITIDCISFIAFWSLEVHGEVTHPLWMMANLSIIFCFLFLRKSSEIFSKLPNMLPCSNLKTRHSWHTLSNAFFDFLGYIKKYTWKFINFVHGLLYLMSYWQQLIQVGLSRFRKLLPNWNFPQPCSKKYHNLFAWCLKLKINEF